MGQESSLGLLCEISWKLSRDSWAPAVAPPLSIYVLGFYDAGTDVQLGHAPPPQAVLFCSPHPSPLSVRIVQCPWTAVGKYFAFDFHLRAVLCAEPKGPPHASCSSHRSSWTVTSHQAAAAHNSTLRLGDNCLFC